MDFSSIHNYYEHLVFNYLREHELARSRFKDEEFLQDVACYSLSRLPARYIRHEVDMAFFVDAIQLEAMEQEVRKTVDAAITYIDRNFTKDNRYAVADNGVVPAPADDAVDAADAFDAVVEAAVAAKRAAKKNK